MVIKLGNTPFLLLSVALFKWDLIQSWLWLSLSVCFCTLAKVVDQIEQRLKSVSCRLCPLLVILLVCSLSAATQTPMRPGNTSNSKIKFKVLASAFRKAYLLSFHSRCTHFFSLSFVRVRAYIVASQFCFTFPLELKGRASTYTLVHCK